jgi:lysophospholipase L1-like esterase
MFGESGKGMRSTVYELGIPGNTARDIINRFEAEVLARVQTKVPEETYIVFSAGTNDSKAVNDPDNYLFTPDEYATNVQAFIQLAYEHAKHVMVVGLYPVDQSKTNPKANPLTGGKSYFTNERIKSFEAAARKICETKQVSFVPLFEQVPADWTKKYLYEDGMHPNDAGHDWILQQVEPKLHRMLKLDSDQKNK